MPNHSSSSTHVLAERVQYRVGHGGFHSTIVSTPGQPPFVYVYDVGAKPKKALVRDAIERFVARLKAVNADRVHYVILSHIDQDHVNSLEALLDALRVANIAVGTVMLPWLNTAEKLLAQAHTNHRNPSTVVMKLVGPDSDAVEYLAGLGAEEVAFIDAEDSDDDSRDVVSALSPTGVPVNARFTASGTDLAASSAVPWKLIALRMQPPDKTISTFVANLRASAKLDPNNSKNHHALLTHHRKKISAAMTAAATSVGFTGYGHSLPNWSCISIFGSSLTPVAAHPAPTPVAGDFEVDCDHGWLHTGDLPLDIPDVWQAFERVWDAHLSGSSVCTLTAPHHGSPNGHTPSLYAKFKPGAAIFTTGWSSKSTVGATIYSNRNAPKKAMRHASASSVVIELHNV